MDDGLCRDIVKRRLPACELFTSRTLLDELARKAAREVWHPSPGFAAAANLREYRHGGEAPAAVPAGLPGCGDDEVLATALAARVDIILTGDRDLLTLKEFQGIQILSPRQFVEWLDRTSAP